MTDEHPIHTNTFSSGAIYDRSIELTFAENKGFYIDSHNADPTSRDGHFGNLSKIKGEVILYPNTNNSVGYKCIGSKAVNQYKVEFWAPTNISFPAIVRINGVIVLQSTDYVLRQTHPLQIDRNRSGNFAEIVVNDRKMPPSLFNLKDMVDSLVSDPNKYFSAFDPLLYEINLQSPLDTLVFDELINVGGGGGLPPGSYQYSLRYSSREGDRTRWSQPTPMIGIMQALSSESEHYPWVKTYGGPPNPSSLTAFAPKLRFRVTNLYNYDYIEIKRIEYNKGAGIQYTSNGVIVARIDVGPGEISVREYIDPQQSNENIVLSADDESREVAYVEACQTVRYYDRRLVLMGVTLASKESALTFEEVNGKQGWPVKDALGKAGHNDPWNHTYRKGFMCGEIEGFAVVPFDGVGNRGFATKIPDLKAFQFPNRRDEVSAETVNFSYGGTVKCANSSANAVGQTHEVFHVYDGVAKENHCDFKNILEEGRVLGLTGTKKMTKKGVLGDCDETVSEVENHGAAVFPPVLGGDVSTAYHPYHPVRQSDPDVTGHGYRVNTKVGTGNIIFQSDGDNDAFQYRPRGFAPDYFATGMMIAGVDNFPTWAKAFSVVRTDSARRVLCQGIGYYSITPADFKFIGNSGLGGKEKNKFMFYAPDIENGILSSDTLNDIIDNPQNYKVQFVSPLGFFSEWYSAESNLLAGKRDRCIDMISYMRIMREHATDNQLKLNVDEDPNMGIPGGDGFNYVCHDKWRNINSIGNIFFNDSAGGNKLFDLATVVRKAEGRGNFLELQLTEDVYVNGSTGGGSQSNFEDQGLKDLHEPLHIINIVRVGATINDTDMQKYKQTTHYQKIESIIGKGNGLADQNYDLVDERWEDCISAPTSADFGASTDRYIYIKLSDGTVEKWQNVTYKTTAQIVTLEQNCLNGVGTVRGLYTHTNIKGLGRRYQINFNVKSFFPPEDSLILVRYDKTAPIRVYGGDTFIGEAIFAPIDRQASARDNAAETQLALGIGLPYKTFKINPRHYTIRKAGAGINAVQDHEWFTLGHARQICVMATIESRTGLHLAYNLNDQPKQFFPLIHYVMRPNRWDPDKSYHDNHIFDDYADDYGTVELSQWKWGGFRFLQQTNPDYSVEPPKAFISKPEFGFTEIRVFPTRIMHSLTRAINVQNSPGLKTFPANNAYDIDDDQGAIKYAWEANTDAGGENLYAFADSGICLLLTKKSILSDLNGGDLGYMSNDGFVKFHRWLNKETGMHDEFWRGAAEALVPLNTDGGKEVLKEALFFPSRQSVYRFMENRLEDIGVNYHSRVFEDGIKNVLPGLETEITGVYDRHKNQYYLSINADGENRTFVFSQKLNEWIGTNDFTFERFTSDGDNTYGHRDMKTYRLNEGYVINGEPITMKVKSAIAPDPKSDKEYIRFRINSSSKPTRVDFYKTKAGAIQTSILASALKNYRGFEQFISRIEASVNPERPLFQDKSIIFEIIETSENEFRIVDTSISWKKIKL
jgi:hypothetical protein